MDEDSRNKIDILYSRIAGLTKQNAKLKGEIRKLKSKNKTLIGAWNKSSEYIKNYCQEKDLSTLLEEMDLETHKDE